MRTDRGLVSGHGEEVLQGRQRVPAAEEALAVGGVAVPLGAGGSAELQTSTHDLRMNLYSWNLPVQRHCCRGAFRLLQYIFEYGYVEKQRYLKILC